MSSHDHDPREQLPVELGILLDALRGEFNSKIAGLKVWGAFALFTGGTLGGLVSRYIAPDQTHAAVQAVARLLPL